MSVKQKVILIVLLAFVATVAGRLFLNFPIPFISLAAETVGKDIFGFWNITNSIIAAWVAMAVVILIAWLGTRHLTLIPSSRMQNLVEGMIDWLMGIVEDMAGKKRGRMFFPLIATIFIFIVIGNWTSLTPIFGTIGKVETGQYIVFHGVEESVSELESVIDTALAEPGANSAALHHLEDVIHEYEEELHEYEEATSFEGVGPPAPTEVDEVAHELGLRRLSQIVKDDFGGDSLVVFDKDSGARFIPFGFDKAKEIDLEEWWNFDEWMQQEAVNLRDDGTSVVVSGETDVDLDGKTVGRLLPFLRSMNTDLMNTLAIALVAMFMVQWWGIRANGFFSYASRFIQFRQGPIGFIVGILEGISEIAKIISFSFRLFGNMFAGEILIFSVAFLLPIMAGVLVFPFLLEVFVGFIQAVVFAMLTLVFAVLATTSHDDHGEEDHGGGP